jgi:hypothetical protein
MKLKIIDEFYSASDFGLVLSEFINQHFQPTYQSKASLYGGDRFQGYPCHESPDYYYDKNPISIGNILKKTFEEKTQIKLLYFKTFLRKIKLHEFKKAASWGQHKPHKDSKTDCDIAGIIYFNSGSIKDGTNLYSKVSDYVPTVIVGSNPNRCVFYDSSIPHQPGEFQEIEDRWVQCFFGITDPELYKKFKENNET